MNVTDIAPFDDGPKRTRRPYLEKAPANPFVKWAGGKRSLIPDILKHFPDHVGTYWEPFIGGGAVFFTLSERMDRAVISDLNDELVLTYHVVKNRVDDLLEALRKHELRHSDDRYYYHVREMEPETSVDIAARFIYLNQTCFNGLYRVNKAGKFNVPKGRYKSPNICNEFNLRAASKALAKAKIMIGDFNKIVTPVQGDFIYCDPPYDDCFTDYQKEGFNDSDQERLRNAAKTWIDKGANVLLSNSDTKLIRRLYRGETEVGLTSTKQELHGLLTATQMAGERLLSF